MTCDDLDCKMKEYLNVQDNKSYDVNGGCTDDEETKYEKNFIETKISRRRGSKWKNDKFR